MTAATTANHRHLPLLPIANLALATAALTISLIAITTNDTTRPSPRVHDDATAAEQASDGAATAGQWRQDVNLMPSGWPATEVMRRATEQASDGAATAGRWRQDVNLMPSGWPATEVMRRATGQASDGAATAGQWRQDVNLMPSGWPATEVMRRAIEQASDGNSTLGD